MKNNSAMLLLWAAVVFIWLLPFANTATAFHGCEDNEGRCDNSPTVYICIQEGSCKFGGE